MVTPREFRKLLRFPYVFAGLAFLAALSHVLIWVFIGYDFSLYMLFTYLLPDIACVVAGFCLLYFGRKKPKETIIPVGILLGLRTINFIYLIFKYSNQYLGQYYVIYSIVSAVILSMILLFYILIVVGVLHDSTLLAIFDGLFVTFEFTAIVLGLVSIFTLSDPFHSSPLVIATNFASFLFLISQAVLSSLPMWYAFSLKKIEPQVGKITLTMSEKLAMIDKLYLMSQRGEITEAEYLEKKKALLKEI